MPNKLLKHLFSKRICFSVSATRLSSRFIPMSRHQLPVFSHRSPRMHSSGRLGLTCILIRHYLRTISRSIWRQPARFNWYLCCGNGAPLAYAAVGPPGSGRRDEQSRRNGWKKIGKMRKSLPFKRQKKTRKQGNEVGALSSDGGGLTAH